MSLKTLIRQIFSRPTPVGCNGQRKCLHCKAVFTPTKRPQGGGENIQVFCGSKCRNKFGFLKNEDLTRARYLGTSNVFQLWKGAKTRARKKGVEFSIAETDILIPETCPLLGVPLVSGRGKKGHNQFSPSLDRIDSTKGYVPGNVWVISRRANTAKNDLTLLELKTLVRNLEKRMT